MREEENLVQKIHDILEGFTKRQLIGEMKKILNSSEQRLQKQSHVDVVKELFYTQYNRERDEKKQIFLADGEKEEHFDWKDPDEVEFRSFLSKFQEDVRHEEKQLAEKRKKNLQQKEEILHAIRELTKGTLPFSDTMQRFKELKESWNNTGDVPKASSKKIEDSFKHSLAMFYNYLDLNRGSKELHMAKNLEGKVRLCEQAEKILEEYKENLETGYKVLQQLHTEWRTLGYVGIEKSDVIWERFSEATHAVQKQYQEFLKHKRKEFEENLLKKTKLCETVEELTERTKDNFSKLLGQLETVKKLQEEWKTIGFATAEHNLEIYVRFNKACNSYFIHWKEAMKKRRSEHQENIKKKRTLCEQAEALQESEDWKETKQKIINLQKEWKSVGYTPKAKSEKLWNRFKAACDQFFERKNSNLKESLQQQEENLKAKQQLIEEITKLLETVDTSATLEEKTVVCSNFQKRWVAIGQVPFKTKNEITTAYKNAFRDLHNKLGIDKHAIEEITFQNILEEAIKSQNINQLKSLQTDNRKEVKELKSTLLGLERNLSFFSSTSTSNLMDSVNKKVATVKNQLKNFKERQKSIDLAIKSVDLSKKVVQK